MHIVQIADGDKKGFMDLLLLADEQENMIDRYIHRGKMFALYDGEVKAVCIVTDEGDGDFELKNIATHPKYQRMGYGKELVRYLFEYYKELGTTLYVGTGECAMTVGFYRSCGFIHSHSIRNFFVDNYDHPMFADGKQLVDMVYFKKTL